MYQPATEGDLSEAIAGLEQRTDTKLDELAGMIRSLGMKMDDFNKD